MTYLLDTNTCIRYINGRAPQIRERMRLILDSEIAISTITMGEMLTGSAKSLQPTQSRARQEVFFSRFAKFSFDEESAYEFGRIRAYLEQRGTTIGPYDMRIASIAIVNGLTVVTHNISEFGRVLGLTVEDWE